MCRNIKPLYNFAPPATDGEIRAASLQFIRKITGFNKPAKINEAAFYAKPDGWLRRENDRLWLQYTSERILT